MKPSRLFGRSAFFNLLVFLAGLAAAFAIGEAAVRVFQPVQLRLRGDDIILSRNTRLVMTQSKYAKMDKNIVKTTNSIGFRGANPPLDFDGRLTIVTIGGSTTECYYLSDGRTWTDRLGRLIERDFNRVWINNAGQDGHSTFGHMVLLRDYIAKLRPKAAIFLVGYNDMGRDIPNMRYEVLTRPNGGNDSGAVSLLNSLANPRKLVGLLARKSDLAALALMIGRVTEARQAGVGHGESDFEALPANRITDAEKERIKREHEDKYLKQYGERLESLARMSRSAGIEPVFVTQPVVWGYAADDVTGVPLGSLDIGLYHDSGALWEVLELYNGVTRRAGERLSVHVVDLAAKMEKSTRYYYDGVHFTNEGAERVAEIIHNDICPHLAARYPGFQSRACPQ